MYVVGGKYAKEGAPGTKLQKVGGPGEFEFFIFLKDCLYFEKKLFRSYFINASTRFEKNNNFAAGLAQMDMPETGPSFGADSLVIPMSDDNPKLARSKLGSYYERFEDGTNSLFGKDASVQLRELRVFHGVYEEGEYIPFTDAEPFALY